MKNNFINRLIKQSEMYNDLNTFLSHETIDYFMKECNAMISGGLAEKIYKKASLGSYLCSDDYNGDIDIYFQSKEDHCKAVKYAMEKDEYWTEGLYKEIPTACIPTTAEAFEKMCEQVNMSHIETGYNNSTTKKQPVITNVGWSCTNISFQGHIAFPKNWGPFRAKFQLIGEQFSGKPSRFLSSFDFANLQRCYFYKNNILAVCESKKCIKLSGSKLLELCHSQSPMMMMRVYKYLKHRGYEGITANSYMHITDWLIRARSGLFKEKIDGIQLFQDPIDNFSIEHLIRDGTIQTKDLALLIGKIIRHHTIKQGYDWYDTNIEDVALNKLKSRGQ
jgi:hypothetical protein